MKLKLPPPLKIALYYLIVLSILAVGLKLDVSYIVSRILAVVAVIVGVNLWPVIKYKQAAFKHPFFTNNLITSLIIFLVLGDNLVFWQLFLVGIVASLIKQLVRINRQPVFNPASAAIVVAVLFGLLESWWGASFAPRFSDWQISLGAFLTLPVGLYLSYKYKKLPLAASFFVIYGVMMALVFKSNPLPVLLEGTMLFFGLIMVEEPKTSPLIMWQQVLFGAGVGAGAIMALNAGLASPYLIPLLVANLLYRLYTAWQQKQHMAKVQQMMAAQVAVPPAVPVQTVQPT